jgi:hypothetical protein
MAIVRHLRVFSSAGGWIVGGRRLDRGREAALLEASRRSLRMARVRPRRPAATSRQSRLREALRHGG